MGLDSSFQLDSALEIQQQPNDVIILFVITVNRPLITSPNTHDIPMAHQKASRGGGGRQRFMSCFIYAFSLANT